MAEAAPLAQVRLDIFQPVDALIAGHEGRGLQRRQGCGRGLPKQGEDVRGLLGCGVHAQPDTVQGRGVTDLGESATRGARALDLGDDLHAIGRLEGRQRVTRSRRGQRVGFDERETARSATFRGVCDSPGDEFGEHVRRAPWARTSGP